MMKRTFALILSTTMSVVFVLTALTGCKKNDVTANGIYDEDITIGEWLELVNYQFWYSNSDIAPGNDAEDELLFAMEHDIVPESGRSWDLGALLTREIAAVTLAGAVTYENTNQMYIEDLGESEYQNEILTVVNHGIMGLNTDNCFMPSENVKYVEGSLYLQTAYSFWANYSFEDAVYDVVLQDNVLDFSGVTDVSVNDDKDLEVDEQAVAEKKQLLDDNHVQFDDDTYILKMDSAEALGITEGSVLVIPDGYGNDGDRAIKVTSLEQQADGTYVAQTEVPEFSEVMQNYEIEDSNQVDFSDMSKCEFYDVNGNPIVIGETGITAEPVAMAGDLPVMMPLMQQGIMSVTPLAQEHTMNSDTKKSFKIEVDGCSFEVELSGSSMKIKTELGDADGAKLEIGKSYEDAEASLEFERNDAGGGKIGIEASNENQEGSVEIGGDEPSDKDKGLNSEEKDDSLKVELGVYEEFEISNMRFDKGINIKDKYAKAVLRFDCSNEFGVTGKITKTWDLFTLKYAVVPGVVLDLKFQMKLGFDGTLTIGVSVDGCAKGFEFSNGNLRYINEGERHVDYKVNAEIALTFPVSFGVSLVDEKVCRIYGEFEGGVGASVEGENNTVEFPEQEPKEIFCADVKIYPIIKLSVGITVADDTWFEVNAKNTWTIMDKDNGGAFWETHLEDNKRVEKCSIKLAKEAWTAKEQKDEAAAYGVDIGDKFILSNGTIKLIVGESAEIRLNEIPAGYSLLDDVYACYAYVENKNTDSGVITVNNIKSMYQNQIFGDAAYSFANKFSRIFDGEDVEMNYLYFDDDNSSTIQFTANNPGTVDLYYKTKDNKHSINCRIIVLTEEEASNTPLCLAETYISVSPGNTKKLEVASIPGKLTEADLIWESEDPSVASVDASGNVTGISNGVTTIVVKTKDGAYSYRCTITVFEGIDNVNVAYEDQGSYLMLQKI